MSHPTVIVTGASGYIGGQTVLTLKDQDYRVIGVDLVPPSENLVHALDAFYLGDFASDHALSLIDEYKPLAIIHCAGTSLVGPSILNPREYYDNNFVKTKTMLDYMIDRKLLDTRVIFSSSAAVYGEPDLVPIVESDPKMPISPYGESKLMIEQMLQSYHLAYGLNYVALRYFNACGADPQGRHGQAPGATHIIARVLESTRDSQTFYLNGNTYSTPDGTCIRDYVHVADIAEAHSLAINRAVLTGCYNLGTKSGASNKEIIALAEKVTGKNVNVIVTHKREGDPAELTADPEFFKEASGWQLQYTLEDVVRHAWKWYVRED